MARPTTIILATMLLLGAFGCARPRVDTTRWDEALRYDAPLDSLGLVEFRLLPDEDVARRREAAARLREGLPGLREHRRYTAALTTLTGLTPDDPHAWAALARECERLGDVPRALEALVSAQRVSATVAPEKRRALRLRLALDRAWLHRDRGEWNLAQAWADSARGLNSEQREVKMLQGICNASRGDAVGAHNSAREIEVKRNEWFEWRWIRGMAEVAQGNLDDAYHWLRGARPEQPWSSRFWRDLAVVCERLGNEPEARLFHRYAIDAAGLPAGTVAEFEMEVRWPGASRAMTLPAWRGYDRLAAGGSVLGWSRAAADSFFRTEDPAMRRAWADLSSTLLSTCIRSGFDNRGSLALRGRLYAEVGAPELALRDLERLLGDPDAPPCDDVQALAWFGRLLLGGQRYREAIPSLERATVLDPEFARAWGDLGLARMMTRRNASGEEALSRALELDPEMAAVWYNRGLARVHARRWEDAVADLRRAHELAPHERDIEVLLRQAEQRLRADRPPPPRPGDR